MKSQVGHLQSISDVLRAKPSCLGSKYVDDAEDTGFWPKRPEPRPPIGMVGATWGLGLWHLWHCVLLAQLTLSQYVHCQSPTACGSWGACEACGAWYCGCIGGAGAGGGLGGMAGPAG